MADALDSKSSSRKAVWVQLPPPVLIEFEQYGSPNQGSHPMSVNAPKSDDDLLNLLRSRGPLGVSELVDGMEATQTAVRHRLTRLLAKKMIQRETVRENNRLARYLFSLTDQGVQSRPAAVRRGR